jgi:(p)ppGpp synthase/HD superfamily hydrolase
LLSKKALKIATAAHKGQVDKAGIDYILHPMVVASYFQAENLKAVAYLHDTLEDTKLTSKDLLEKGMPEDVIQAVEAMTKVSGEDYFKYLERVKANDLARQVKIADLKHNSDLSRLKTITEKDIKRREKYLKAIEFLKN